MDKVLPTEEFDTLASLKRKTTKPELCLYPGVYPHRAGLRVDPLGMQVAAFIDYARIVIFPYLHRSQTKLRLEGGHHSRAT
jgi:hypothetical protein